MGERKVLNKRYPPDFDPEKLRQWTRSHKHAKGPITITLAIPFRSLRCEACREFIYQGTKFNAKKEVTHQNYLGIPIHRFWIKCPTCSNHISFETDPKNSDYKIHSGAKRAYDAYVEWEEPKPKEAVKNLETLEKEAELNLRMMKDLEHLDLLYQTLNEKRKVNPQRVEECYLQKAEQVKKRELEEDELEVQEFLRNRRTKIKRVES